MLTVFQFFLQLTLSLPKLSHTESNKKSERNSSSNSSSSSQDDSGSDYGGYTPNRHKMVIKTKTDYKN